MARHDPVYQWTRRSDDPSAALEPGPGDGLGAVEPGHGAGPLLRPDRRDPRRGDLAAPQGEHRPPAAARVLLRGGGQARRTSARRCGSSPASRRCCAGCWPATPAPRWRSPLDATTLGSRFVVLAISVVYRGCAIPVAWAVLPAGDKGAWRPEWLRLLGLLAPAIPPAWTVIVLADRGLYARWLFQAIVAHGWHPFLRVNLGGTFRPAGPGALLPAAPVRADGRASAGRGGARPSRPTGWTAPCWPTGPRAAPTRGWC